ncbi:hypothetical protein [Aestuariivirga sp.]|jgi:CDP-glycerol glycerophosphotransferase|uniref:hypothetical protein n=1 Tax=Aestuariivirga sp. TaxID=2650926 RepID=UPI003783E9C8
MALKHLRHAPEYANLASTIRAYSFGRRLFYAPNIGNWGDALIHHGTLQFLHHHQIDCQQLPRLAFAHIRNSLACTGMRLSGAVLLAGGGGAWCRNYEDSRQFLSICGALFDHVIVLPTTFELPALDLHHSQVTYFRRDQFRSAESIPHSQFCHDMAFFLDLAVSGPAHGKEVGNFFRIDRERSAASSIPEDNLDLSLNGTDETDPAGFFQALAGHGRIRTDRLHVAIASCLLGLPCDLYPGNYFKSADLFRSSIETNYSSCSLISW